MIATNLTLATFRERWLARRDELRTLHALVDGAELCDRMVAELDAALRAEHSTVLSLRAASRASGYSADHLGRLIRAGVLPNAGRPNAPRLRLADIPKKAGVAPDLTLVRDSVTSRVQIARSVVASMKEHDHD